MERGEIIDFFHRGLYKAIHALYLQEEKDKEGLSSETCRLF